MWATHSVANFLRITWDIHGYPTPTSCEYIFFFLLSHPSQEYDRKPRRKTPEVMTKAKMMRILTVRLAA
jgi:hypothetical protein